MCKYKHYLINYQRFTQMVLVLLIYLPNFALLKFLVFLKVITNKEDLSSSINQFKERGLTIGLVPTMGALHNGHLSLIKQSKSKTDITVASIFVNPTQFTNQEDLKNYPKPIESDIKKLEEAGCDILFHPSVEEMYGDDEDWNYEVGDLDQLLEGEFRPGHYKGVTQIVNKLFKAVSPDIAFFGQKDYQQFLVINKMVKDLELPLQLIAGDIIREENGLAMSSRNVRLKEEELLQATTLFQALKFIKENYSILPLSILKEKAFTYFDHPLLKLEYLKICDVATLQELTEKEKRAIVLIACYVGTTRLIDNMMLP
jgi:pantoate--beta-alanine ligase